MVSFFPLLQLPWRLPRSPVGLDLLESLSLGLWHEEKGKEPCPDGNDSVQPECTGFTQDLRKSQKRLGHQQVGAPVGNRPDAHGAAADADRINLRKDQPENRSQSHCK